MECKTLSHLWKRHILHGEERSRLQQKVLHHPVRDVAAPFGCRELQHAAVGASPLGKASSAMARQGKVRQGKEGHDLRRRQEILGYFSYLQHSVRFPLIHFFQILDLSGTRGVTRTVLHCTNSSATVAQCRAFFHRPANDGAADTHQTPCFFCFVFCFSPSADAINNDPTLLALLM